MKVHLGLGSLVTLAGFLLVMTSAATAQVPRSLWAHDNLFAWGVSVDSKSPTTDDCARLLERLGLKQLAYDWQNKDVATFDEQIEIFERHGIRLLAWAIFDVDDPDQEVDWRTHKIQDISVLAGLGAPASNAMTVGQMLEMFKRHRIAPQLWLIRRMQPRKPSQALSKPFSEMTDAEKNKSFREYLGYDFPSTPSERARRVEQESKRIKALAELAALYGVKVGLYKHGGWIGVTDNQVAIVESLRRLGVTNVGIVYQFIHAHDEVDDTVEFPKVWEKVKPYVVAVNITGMHKGRTDVYPIIYPGQGDLELQMMRTIQDSGWKGPVGLSAERGFDQEIDLRNNITGVDSIAVVLNRSGTPLSGSSR